MSETSTRVEISGWIQAFWRNILWCNSCSPQGPLGIERVCRPPLSSLSLNLIIWSYFKFNLQFTKQKSHLGHDFSVAKGGHHVTRDVTIIHPASTYRRFTTCYLCAQVSNLAEKPLRITVAISAGKGCAIPSSLPLHTWITKAQQNNSLRQVAPYPISSPKLFVWST